MRRFLPLVLLVLVNSCGESPTLSGGNGASLGSGALIVTRSDFVVGVSSPPVPRYTVIDPNSGATRSLATWLPAGDPDAWPRVIQGLTFSRDGEWMAWIRSREVTGGTCYPVPGHGCWSTDRAMQQLFVSRVGAREPTLLTPEYSYDGEPSFSPDGKRLVVLRESYDGEEQMVTIARDGTDEQPVLLKSRRRRAAPDWSPNGDEILYQRPELGALYLVKPDGRDPRPFAEGVTARSTARWSPDGSKIATMVNKVEAGGDGLFQELVIVASDGTVLRRFPEIGPYRTPVWSPDGTRLAYTADVWVGTYTRSVVRVLELASGVVQTITPVGFSDADPIWRP